MPKGIHNSKRGAKKKINKLVKKSVYASEAVHAGLTPKEKRWSLERTHEEKMSDLAAFMDKMMKSLNSK